MRDKKMVDQQTDIAETNFRGAGQTQARQFLRRPTKTLVIGRDNNG